MNVRSMRYNQDNTIDCEIEHPVYGWIPFTASPDDAEQHGREIYVHIISNMEVAACVPPPADELLAQARASASLSRMQFMLALDAAGLLDDAEALIADPGTPRSVKIMWASATDFDRLNPELVQMAYAMGLSDSQIDAVYGIEV